MTTTPMSVEARLALLDARQLLLTDGWVQGDFRCPTGGHCASGALRAVLGGKAYDSEVERPEGSKEDTYNEAAEALAAAIDPDWRSIYDLDPGEFDIDAVEDTIFCFNDGRVKSDEGRAAVLAKFDEAAGL